MAAVAFTVDDLLADWSLTGSGFCEALTGRTDTFLTAVYEVETSLTGYEQERERHALLTSQRGEAQASADLQAQRYAAGVVGYADYLDALRTLLGVQSNLSAAGTDLALARLAVHRALGGGWTSIETTP